MSDIQPGDVVVCVDASPPVNGGEWLEAYGPSLERRQTYRVAKTDVGQFSGKHGIETTTGERGYSYRFRKIRPADEQFTAHIRALKPVREDA